MLPRPPSPIHIVGIGGAGMSPIARVLLGRGYRISGSDRQANTVTEALSRDGAHVYVGHAASQIAGAELVLISSAVPPENPEVTAARAAGIPVLKRRDALGAITEGFDVIAVAGTHGKTTTSGLITHLMMQTGNDPTYIVGGTLLNTGTNAAVGSSQWFVIEADEYDYMFLGLAPRIAVITNIEHDHPDMFPALSDVRDAFRQFAANIRADGALIVCGADDRARELAQAWSAERGQAATLYGIAPSSEAQFVRKVAMQGCERQAGSADWLQADHNQLNALAALSVLEFAGVSLDDDRLQRALCAFKGTGRRMEALGETAGGLSIYSDYGHHPTALRATLQGARARFGDRSIWAVWQPHTYSRTHLLAHEFSGSFQDADHVLITDIYASREQPSPGPGPQEIAFWARSAAHPDVRASGSLAATAAILKEEAHPGDVLIIFSAGDAPAIADMLLSAAQ